MKKIDDNTIEITIKRRMSRRELKHNLADYKKQAAKLKDMIMETEDSLKILGKEE